MNEPIERDEIDLDINYDVDPDEWDELLKQKDEDTWDDGWDDDDD